MVKSNKTVKTLAEVEYNRELKRIKQFIRRASKRGFIWEDSVIPEKPKKVTQKSVERLKKLTPTVLYKKGGYVDTETGELLPGTTGRHIERKKSAQKAKQTRKTKTRGKGTQNNQYTPEPEQPETEHTKGDYEYYPDFTDVVIANFIATLNQFPNAEGVPLLMSWLNRLIDDNGRGNVAQMLQDGASEGLIVTWETVYKATATKTYMTEMMNYLPDQGNLYADQIMDMIEQIEWWEQPE